MLDMTDSIAPRSDQMNSDDLMSGPRTFTIAEVRKTGADDQPVAVYLAEFPADRPFKPSKSMRRVMVAAWGADASAYVGKRMTLYRDPAVRFGGQDVGGIRVSHMSDLKKPLTLALTVTRGKRAPYIVKPLADEASAPAVPTAEELITAAQLATTNEGLDRLAFTAASSLKGDELATVKEIVTARRAELSGSTT